MKTLFEYFSCNCKTNKGGYKYGKEKKKKKKAIKV